mmetsp:Transcript_3600/g.15231  ORF Transcript_3600/g.15231 Transcript_3600/m.15231 type:complete len:313 (-) Transcript_3600:454-1392(-)
MAPGAARQPCPVQAAPGPARGRRHRRRGVPARGRPFVGRRALPHGAGDVRDGRLGQGGADLPRRAPPLRQSEAKRRQTFRRQQRKRRAVCAPRARGEDCARRLGGDGPSRGARGGREGRGRRARGARARASGGALRPHGRRRATKRAGAGCRRASHPGADAEVHGCRDCRGRRRRPGGAGRASRGGARAEAREGAAYWRRRAEPLRGAQRAGRRAQSGRLRGVLRGLGGEDGQKKRRPKKTIARRDGPGGGFGGGGGGWPDCFRRGGRHAHRAEGEDQGVQRRVRRLLQLGERGVVRDARLGRGAERRKEGD